ncbi:hypothetical protein SAMN02745945_00132 [Peptoclostridium litorale DSM 5388]|uniref:N-acetyltransferase domain-containing protein n=1 Tax=Peptoclostridium litorale DSM 5388 TaxID=1121324 RepID=A0A069RIN3_PEPLI|nr:GNAT family N-acetyltransferase [Peptoclostridium litorale]KDR96618.1 hypothetical protein CLIT_2c02240 [Peptoclostridium litorale DSM 5388]SIN68404.1 hypothetical protein SAMN02745945_00132 [Peptoclostridium litorale DSM 5388]
MNFQSKRFIFELASPKDSEEILNILEEDDFKGNISICYTRRPNAYDSFMKEGDEVHMLVCRDTHNSAIAGMGALACRMAYINGKEEKVGYLFGLRIKKGYRKAYSLIPRGYAFIHSLLEKMGIRYIYTTILEENKHAQRIFEKKRASIPHYEFLCNYNVYALKANPRQKSRTKDGFTFRRASKGDIPEIIEFLNAEGKKKHFYPQITEDLITHNCIPGLNYDDFHLLFSRQNEILACGALWNQQSYKQYIVKKYGGLLKLLHPISTLLPIAGYPALPKLDSILDFSTLSFWAIKGGSREIFNVFLNGISQCANSHTFFLIGINERDPLKDLLDKTPHINYSSRVYLVNWEKSIKVAGDFDSKQSIYIECGML